MKRALFGFAALAAASVAIFPAMAQTPAAKGVYRMPYPDGTQVSIGNDHITHGPDRNRIDMNASSAGQTIIAAAAGRIEIIVDNNNTFCPGTPSGPLSAFETDGDPGIDAGELQAAFNASPANQTTILNAFQAVCNSYTGASATCCVRSVTNIGQTCQWMGAPAGVTCGSGTDGDGPNNFVWMSHPNGEWSKYSHIQFGTATQANLRPAGTPSVNGQPQVLSVGLNVPAGYPIGVEGDVGNASGRHLHFEVAGIDSADEIGATGFLNDVDSAAGVNLRNRAPTFCQIGLVVDGQNETSAKCDDTCTNANEVVGGVFTANSPELTIQATNTVTTNANVQPSGGLALRAGQKVTLLPGFSAVGGGFFAAEIGACDAPGGTGDG